MADSNDAGSSVESGSAPIMAPRGRLAELIADDLRSAIVRTLQVGDRLPSERELIELYGASRPIIREVLFILEMEGVVTVRRGARGGPVVSEVALDSLTRTFGVYLQQHGTTLQDIFDARYLIEPAAVRLAASQLSPDVSELDRLVEREAEMLESGNPDSARNEVEFHRAVLDLGGQFTLASLGHLLEAVVSRHATENQADASDDAEAHQEAHRAHRLIVEAIRERDPVRAERRMLKHLRAALETMPLRPSDRANIFGTSTIDLRAWTESGRTEPARTGSSPAGTESASG